MYHAACSEQHEGVKTLEGVIIGQTYQVCPLKATQTREGAEGLGRENDTGQKDKKIEDE